MSIMPTEKQRLHFCPSRSPRSLIQCDLERHHDGAHVAIVINGAINRRQRLTWEDVDEQLPLLQVRP